MDKSVPYLHGQDLQDKFEKKLEQEIRALKEENDILVRTANKYFLSVLLTWTTVIPLSLWGSIILSYLGTN